MACLKVYHNNPCFQESDFRHQTKCRFPLWTQTSLRICAQLNFLHHTQPSPLAVVVEGKHAILESHKAENRWGPSTPGPRMQGARAAISPHSAPCLHKPHTEAIITARARCIWEAATRQAESQRERMKDWNEEHAWFWSIFGNKQRLFCIWNVRPCTQCDLGGNVQDLARIRSGLRWLNGHLVCIRL